MPGWLVLGNPSEKGKLIDKITRIGVDLAKNLIQLHGVDSMERVVAHTTKVVTTFQLRLLLLRWGG